LANEKWLKNRNIKLKFKKSRIMKTTKKLNLEELNVNSFVTNLDANEKKTVDGGSTPLCASFILTALACPITFAISYQYNCTRTRPAAPAGPQNLPPSGIINYCRDTESPTQIPNGCPPPQNVAPNGENQ